jgi:ATP-binding cassette subfamily B protein
MPDTTLSNVPLSPLRESLVLARNRRGLLSGAVFLNCIAALLTLVPYWGVYEVASGLLSKTIDRDGIVFIVLIVIAATVLRHAVHWTTTLVAHHIALDVIHKLRQRLYHHLNTLPLSYFDTHHPADLARAIEDDTEALEDTIAHMIPETTAAVVVPFGLICVLFWIDWRLAIACVAPYLIASILMGRVIQRGRHVSLAFETNRADMLRTISDIIRNLATVRLFNRSGAAMARIRGAFHKHEDLTRKWITSNVVPVTFFTILASSSLPIIVAAGYILYRNDSLSVESWLLFGVLSLGLNKIYGNFVDVTLRYGKQRDIWQKLNRILNSPPQHWPSHSAVPLANVDIVLDAVEVRYGSRAVLRDISFCLPSGSSLAIVGASGAGKSTLAKLVSRMLDPTSGQVCIGGHPVTDYDETTLRRMVSYVSQDVELLNLSIAENIALGRPDASRDEIERAAAAARCTEFISALPQGYDTPLGENGEQLSGGQRQRLSIARAIILDAPILVLDEAFAYSDVENEVLIQQALNELTRDKTLIVVSHRLNAIKHCTHICVLDQGRIREWGSHHQLIGQGGLYAALWRSSGEGDQPHV